VKLFLFGVQLAILLILFPQTASAGVGAASNVLPNNASLIPSGAKTPWTGVSACYTVNCMKGKNTFSYVYVPEGTTQFTMTILDGCFERDNDAALFYTNSIYEEGSSTTYTGYNLYPARQIPATNPAAYSLPATFPVTPVNYLNFTTKTREPAVSGVRICPQGRRDIVRQVTVDPSLAPQVIIGGSVYRVFIFHARANTAFFYVNQFRLSATNGVYLGFSSMNITLDGENFWTSVSSAKYNSGNSPQWQFSVEFAAPCTATPTIYSDRDFAWFDADNGVYQFNDELKYEIVELNRSDDAPTGLVYGGNLTGGNDVTASARHNYSSQYKYRLRIYGIAEVNSQQFRLPFDQVYAQSVCNTAPSGSMSLPCLASGLVTVTNPRVQDAEGGVLTVTGAHIGNVSVLAGVSTPVALTPATFNGLRDNVAHTVTLTVTDSGGLAGAMSASYTCALPPPIITATCSATGSVVEPGGVYSPFIVFTHRTPAGADAAGRVVLTVRDQANNVLAGSGRQNLSFTIAHPVSPAGTRDTSVGVTGATYGFAAPNSTISFPTPGTYTATYDWSWTAAGGTQSGPPAPTPPLTTDDCVVTITVATRPYFKVLGDIITISPSAVINGWNQALGGLGYEPTFPVNIGGSFGAGAQGMILSAGTTSGVTSKFRNPGGSLRSLTMSNTTPPGDLTWGGQFGVPFLMPQPALANLRPSATVNAVSGIVTGAYTLSGNTLSGGSIPAGRQVTIYAEGDVRIVPGAANGIVYGNAAGYATRNDIPRFRLIATGNIFVDPAVTQLDGEYIAGNGGVGSVYTCFAPGWSVPIDGVVNNPYGVCASTLLVNGSLTGDSIKLTRAVGTLRNAASNDADLIGVNSYRNSGNIAEIIQYTPELFLVNPVSSGANSNYGYDSITALPPLF
jgi:hypothetical protein